MAISRNKVYISFLCTEYESVMLHVVFVKTAYNPYKKVYVTRAEKILANSVNMRQQQSQCHYNTRASSHCGNKVPFDVIY